MTENQIAIVVYLFFCALKVRSFRNRWRLPLFRGEEWFLGKKVSPGFYRGPGQPILRRYRLSLLWPLLVEAAAMAAIVYTGKLMWLMNMVVILVVVMIPYNSWIVRQAQKAARPFEQAAADSPAPSMVLSLKTRRLADYANRKLDMLLALVMVVSLAFIAHYYMTNPGIPFREIWRKPVLLIYLDVGVLLAKRGLVAWRTVVPREHAARYLQLIELRRKFLLSSCDGLRIWWAAALVCAAIQIPMRDTWHGSVAETIWVLIIVAFGIAMTAWLTRIKRKYLELAAQNKPLEPPTPLEGGDRLDSLLCYRPATPLMVLRGGERYALNLASIRTQLLALYVTGLAAVLVWL